ncbi:hypothetical protein K350107B32_31920 [Agathobaculum butyriciproducens]
MGKEEIAVYRQGCEKEIGLAEHNRKRDCLQNVQFRKPFPEIAG